VTRASAYVVGSNCVIDRKSAAMSMSPASRADETDVLTVAQSWLAKDGAVALATIVETWGSAPVPIGGQMVIGRDGQFEGSVSGGCVEGDVISDAIDCLEDGKVRTLSFGVEDETAWRVGLPCGGKIRVFVERLEGAGGQAFFDRAVSARTSRVGLVVKTQLADGARTLYERDTPGLDTGIERRFFSGKSSLEAVPQGEVFVHALMPPPRVLIVGATHIGQILAEMVQLTGYQVVVVDPRTAFAAEARFPGITLVTDWPQDALPKLGLDPYTAVAALSHVGHIDDEALKLAVKSDCVYIGALGSKRNHAKRTERLLEAGITAEQIARIACPIGLDIGAGTPPEIAVSVLAEIIRALRGERGKGAKAA
jgi:xanthine dehydrogenase accessory factor